MLEAWLVEIFKEQVGALAEGGADIIDFGIGDPDMPTPSNQPFPASPHSNGRPDNKNTTASGTTQRQTCHGTRLARDR